jgi:hypothetical protein
MTEHAAPQYRPAGRAEEATSGWAVGFILFAGIMMLMSGIFQAFAGLVALFENEFYVATRNYLFQFDATTWGWIHLVGGVVVALASAIVNFAFIPYYPFWSLLVIALDVFVIWALAAHGRDVATDSY